MEPSSHENMPTVVDNESKKLMSRSLDRAALNAKAPADLKVEALAEKQARHNKTIDGDGVDDEDTIEYIYLIIFILSLIVLLLVIALVAFICYFLRVCNDSDTCSTTYIVTP